MVSFLHAADIHLDSPLLKLERYEGAPVEALRSATRRALDNLVALAVDRAVDFVLIAGDLYDGTWRDYNTGLFFASRMSRLGEAGIPVFLIAGNHDAASRMTRSLRLPENVHTFPVDRPGTVRLADLRVAIHGQGFATPAVKQNLATGYPPAVPGHFNIGLLHTGAMGSNHHAPYAPCTLDDLRTQGYDYWALGHVHERKVLCERPYAAFPGNLQGRHVRETGPKGCLQVIVENGDPSVRFRPLDTVRWEVLRVDAAGCDDGYAVVDRFQEILSDRLAENGSVPLAVRVVIEGRTPAYDDLAARPERWINEIRLTAADASGGRVWIERVDTTSASPGRTDPHPADGPLGEILSFLEDLRSDPVGPLQPEALLSDLIKKLPRELREGEEGIRPEDPAWLSEMIESVGPLLLARLSGREPES